jgi:hypothetical protein
MEVVREGNDLDACFVRSFKCIFFFVWHGGVFDTQDE